VIESYRPPLYIKEASSESVLHKIRDATRICPGGEGLVDIFLLNPGKLGADLAMEQEFEWREGSRVVAKGVILSISHLDIEDLVTRHRI
jgi:translation elongation factor EF-Tu-like GTPase